jgi:hypothetical protein
VRSFPASIWRGNLSWQWHEPQIVRRWPGCGLGSSSRRRGLGLPHHHRRQASWARAVHVVVAQGMSELMSIFITSMALLSSTVARWLGTPKKLRRTPGRVVRRAELDSLGTRGASLRAAPTSSLAARTAGSTRRLTPRAPRPVLARKINCVRSLRPGSRTVERDATRGWRGLGPVCFAGGGAGTLLDFVDHLAALAPDGDRRPRGDRPLMGAGSFE